MKNNELYINQKRINTNPVFPELSLASNNIEKLEIDRLYEDTVVGILPFEHLSNVKELKFFESSINNFFKFSKYLPNLEKLDIIQTIDSQVTSNQIIDEEFIHLKNLMKLSISSNKTEVIPESINELSRLRTLSLSIITKLPRNISLLPQLEEFGLSIVNDQIDKTETLDVISQLQHLKAFGYEDPYTSQIPQFKDNLTSLESFSLRMVQLKEIPEVVRNFKELKYLHISIDLQTVPQWIRELKNLEYIAIEALADSELPTFLKELPKLEAIDLRGCLDIFFDESKVEKIKRNFKDFKVLGVNANY